MLAVRQLVVSSLAHVLSVPPQSVSAALMATVHGARILRVHDVAETVDALKIWQAVEQQAI